MKAELRGGALYITTEDGWNIRAMPGEDGVVSVSPELVITCTDEYAASQLAGMLRSMGLPKARPAGVKVFWKTKPRSEKTASEIRRSVVARKVKTRKARAKKVAKKTVKKAIARARGKR